MMMKNDKHLWAFQKDNNNYANKMFNDRASIASSKSKKLIYRDKPPVDNFNEFYMKKIHGHNRNMTSSTSTCSPVHNCSPVYNYRKSENVRDYYNVPKNSQPMRQYASRYNSRFSNGVSHVVAPPPSSTNNSNQCHKSYCNCNYNNPTMRRNNILSRSMDELRSEYSYDIVSTPTNSINNKHNNNNNHHNNNNNYMTNNNNYSNIRKFSKPGYIPNNRNSGNSGVISSKTRRLSQTSRPKQYSMDNLLTIENITFDENEEDYHQNEAGRPHFVAVTSLEDVQAVRCAEFHPSGRIYAVGSNSKTFRICEYPTLADVREDHTTYQPTVLFKRTKHHKGSIYCMGWAPDGELVATGSNDKTIKLMRYNDVNKQLEGRETELTMHDGTVRDLCFLEDTTNKASLLISGGAGDCKIYVTDCATATPFQALSGHGGHILSLYNWGGAMFCSGSQDKTIRFWDLRTRGCVNTITPATNPGSRQGSPVAGVCVDPSGRLLVSGHEDSSCVLYDIRGNRPIQCFKPHASDIRSIRFSPSAYYLLTSGYDNKLVLTDLQGDLTLPLPSVVVAQHTDKVISGRWHPTDFSFLSTSADKTATLWALPPS